MLREKRQSQSESLNQPKKNSSAIIALLKIAVLESDRLTLRISTLDSEGVTEVTPTTFENCWSCIDSNGARGTAMPHPEKILTLESSVRSFAEWVQDVIYRGKRTKVAAGSNRFLLHRAPFTNRFFRPGNSVP